MRIASDSSGAAKVTKWAESSVGSGTSQVGTTRSSGSTNCFVEYGVPSGAAVGVGTMVAAVADRSLGALGGAGGEVAATGGEVFCAAAVGAGAAATVVALVLASSPPPHPASSARALTPMK